MRDSRDSMDSVFYGLINKYYTYDVRESVIDESKLVVETHRTKFLGLTIKYKEETRPFGVRDAMLNLYGSDNNK